MLPLLRPDGVLMVRGQGLVLGQGWPLWPAKPAPAARPARLVFLLQDLKFGGTQRQTLALARLPQPGWFQPEVWLLAGGDDLAPLARDWGLPLIRLSRQAQVGPRALPTCGAGCKTPLLTCSCP